MPSLPDTGFRSPDHLENGPIDGHDSVLGLPTVMPRARTFGVACKSSADSPGRAFLHTVDSNSADGDAPPPRFRLTCDSVIGYPRLCIGK